MMLILEIPALVIVIIYNPGIVVDLQEVQHDFSRQLGIHQHLIIANYV